MEVRFEKDITLIMNSTEQAQQSLNVTLFIEIWNEIPQYTWNVTEVSNRSVFIQLEIENPYLVIPQSYVEVYVNFFDREDLMIGRVLYQFENLNLTHILYPQIFPNEQNKIFSESFNYIIYFLEVYYSFNIFVSLSMNLAMSCIWEAINSL